MGCGRASAGRVLLSIPEVRCSNPVIAKIYIEHLFTVNCIQKTNIKKKRPGMAHYKKQLMLFTWSWKSRVYNVVIQLLKALFIANE